MYSHPLVNVTIAVTAVADMTRVVPFHETKWPIVDGQPEDAKHTMHSGERSTCNSPMQPTSCCPCLELRDRTQRIATTLPAAPYDPLPRQNEQSRNGFLKSSSPTSPKKTLYFWSCSSEESMWGKKVEMVWSTSVLIRPCCPAEGPSRPVWMQRQSSIPCARRPSPTILSRPLAISKLPNRRKEGAMRSTMVARSITGLPV